MCLRPGLAYCTLSMSCSHHSMYTYTYIYIYVCTCTQPQKIVYNIYVHLYIKLQQCRFYHHKSRPSAFFANWLVQPFFFTSADDHAGSKPLELAFPQSTLNGICQRKVGPQSSYRPCSEIWANPSEQLHSSYSHNTVWFLLVISEAIPLSPPVLVIFCLLARDRVDHNFWLLYPSLIWFGEPLSETVGFKDIPK